MIAYMLLIIAVMCMAADGYIWTRYFRKAKRKWMSVSYIVLSVLLDAALPVAFYVVTAVYGGEGHAAQAMLWLMWLLLLSFVPKVVFALFLALNDLLNRIVRRRWHIFEAVGGVLAGMVVVLMVYGVVRGVSTIRVNRVVVASPEVPEAFDGYRVVQFSDLHTGNLAPSGRLIRDMVDTVLSLSPGLIVNSGDLVNIRSSEITPKVFRELRRLEAPDGVVSVLGNHDLGIYIPGKPEMASQSLERLKGLQSALGWKLLQNEKIWLRKDRDSIAVAGVDFPHNGRHQGMQSVTVGSDLARAMDGVDSARFALLVAHTPSIWDSIPEVAAPDLTVAGHIHAMQLKFEAGKCRFSPAEYLYPEWSGLYVKNGRRLYVNDGIGYVLFPMRIGAPAEVTLYELRRSAGQ